MSAQNVTIQISAEGAEATAAAFERVAVAVRKAREELALLANVKHGGVSIKIVGELATCEVRPYRSKR